MKINSLFISDLHIGSPVCQSEKILKVLESYNFETLYIVGDTFDDKCPTRLNKKCWKVLTKIRSITKNKKVYALKGNHCREIIDWMGEFLGCEVIESIDIEIDQKNFLVIHGDCFDDVITKYSRLSYIAGKLYYYLQKIDLEFCLKIKSKFKFLSKCNAQIQKNAIDHCAKNHYKGVILGHTHDKADFEKGGVRYVNLGCFVEKTCSYATIDLNGKLKLHEI